MAAIALVGSGYMARTHAAAWRELGQAEVRYVVSRRREHAAALAARLGAVAATDLAEALSDPTVDAVDLCVPTDLHRDLAVAAFAADKHVFLEKPLALNLADADAILAAAERAARILMVGLVLRFWPEYAEACQRVTDGTLGHTRMVTAQRLSPPADWNTWMADPARSGGVTVDLMCHDFDVASALLGQPLSVFARQVTGQEHVLAVVEHERGTATVEGSMSMPGGFPFTSLLRVGCDGGALEYSFRVGTAAEGGNLGAAEGPAGLIEYRDGAGPQRVIVAAADPFARELAHFVDCISSGSGPRHGTGAQARTALAVSLAAARSTATRRAERVTG